MTLLDLLRKLGIYRSGKASWSGDASERTMPFISEGVMDEKKDISTKEELKQGGTVSNVVAWIFGSAFLVIGFFMLFSYFLGGLIFMSFGALLTPTTSSTISEKLNFNPSRRQLALIIIVGFVIFVMFNKQYMSPSTSIDLPVTMGQASEEGMKDFSISLGTMVQRYRDAFEYQQALATIPYGSINVEESRLLISNALHLWDLVEESVEELENLSMPLVAQKQKVFAFINKAFALGPMDDVESPLNAGEVGTSLNASELKAIEDSRAAATRQAEIDLVQKKWKQADLARLAYPDKNWLIIVKTAFKEDARTAKTRLDARNADLQIEYKNEDDYNRRWAQGLTVVSTGGKVVLFTAALPEAIAAGGVVVAGQTLLAGVDVAFSVGDSVNIMVHDGKEDLLYTQAKNAVAPLLLMTSINSVLKNPSTWTKDTVLSLADVAALAHDQAGNLGGVTVLNADGSPKIEYYDSSVAKLFGPDGDGNEDLPAHLKLPTKKQREEKIRDRAQDILNALNDPDYRNALEKLEQDRLQRMTEQARKDAAIQEIIKRKEAERAQTAVQDAAKKELKQLESTLPKSEAISPLLETPAPQTPAPKPLAPKVESNTVVNSCSVCLDSGMDCTCGMTTCVCCSPGTDCWPK